MVVTAGLPKLSEIKVNGIDVTSYCRPSRARDGDMDNEPSTFGLVLVKNAETVLGPLRKDTMIGKAVTFSRGIATATEEWVFRGEVVNLEANGRLVMLNCRDQMWRAVKKIETNVYKAADSTLGNPKAIYTDLMQRAGVPLTESYIQDPGADYTVNKFTVDTANVKERADRLVKMLPNWRHYYDPQVDSARMEVVQHEDSGVTLTVGVNILNLPDWKNEGEKLVQTLTIRGATQTVDTQQTFSGDGVTTEFLLSQEPETVLVEISGVEKVAGILGVTDSGSYDYYVDKVEKKIIFLVAPANAVDNVVVYYGFKQERPVTVTNPGSIAKYSTQGTEQYPYEDVTTSFDSLDIEDARLYGEGILSQDSEVSPVTQLNVKGYSGLRRNMRVGVIDTRSGINESVYIRAIEKTYPYGFDVLYVNRKPQDAGVAVGNMFNRIKRLEENASRGAKTLFVTKPSGRQVAVGRRQFRKRSRTWTPSYGGFVFGSSRYGVIGVSPFDADIKSSAWYVLESDANDEYGAFNGTPNALTYVGKGGLLSAAFNGTTSRVDLPASNTVITNNGAWSIAVRFNADATTSGARIINMATTTGNTAVRIYFSSAGILGYSYRNGGGTIVDAYTVAVSTNTWYHAAMTWDGTNLRCYLNGVLVDTDSTSFFGFGAGISQLGVFNGSGFFDGNMCDVRVYDGHTLVADEITALYAGGVPRENDELFYSGWTTNWVVPAEDVHREYLTSTDSVHVGYTTATIDTGAQTATASGGAKTLVLGPIAVGPSVSRVKISINYTGTLTSVDVADNAAGTGSQSLGAIVSGQLKTVSLTTPITSVYLIIAMASGAVISVPFNAYDVPTAPAVRFVLDSYT